MGLLTSWIYPIRGVVFLLTTPQLLQLVLRFLGIVTAASCASTILCFALLWSPHMALLGRFLGVNIASRLLATALIVGESALPIYLVFDHRLKKLGRQLFDTTLLLKLGRAAPAGSTQHGDALAAYQEAQQAAKSSDKSERTSLLSSLAAAGPASQRVPSLAPLQPRDSQALSRMVTQYRQSEAAAQHQRSLLSAALDLGMKLLVKPQAGEGLLMRKARDLITVVFGVAVPGAALLLPLAVYRDSGAEVTALMSRYWEAKGIRESDAHQLLADSHMSELRGFGLVATGLSYIPVLNWALSLSNNVAAALYAAHLEAKGAPLLKTWWL